MKGGCLLAIIGAVAVVLVLGLTVMGFYNGIVTQDEECNKAWGNVESVLQRRFDLIPIW